MRKSKYDKFVFFACLVVFLYSFFFVGWETVYVDNNVSMSLRRVDHIVYPASILIAPIAGIMFFFLMVFDDELLVVDRYWVKDGILGIVEKGKKKLREGIREYHEYRK